MGRAILLCLGLLGFALLPPSVDAQAEPGTPDSSLKGLTVELSYTGDVFTSVTGGRRRDIAYLDNIDITASLELEGMLGSNAPSLYVYGLGNQGGDPSGFIGDAQGVNNIEAVNAWRLFELWLQQRFWDDRVSLLLGLYDLNSEFDVIQSAAVLLNSSFGIGAEFASSRELGPSIFPVTSLGARLRVVPAAAWYGQFTVLDGVPGNPADPADTHIEFAANDGALMAAEIGLMLGDTHNITESGRAERARRRRVSRLEAAQYAAKFALGGWTYTADFAAFSDADGDGSRDRRSGNWGLYALAEAQLRHEPEDPTQGLWVFGRAGIADSDVNRFASYSGAGLVYRGPFPTRDDDEVAFGVAAAHNGAEYRAAERAAGRAVQRSEIALEVTYSAAITAQIAVQTDLQYVIAPNTDPMLDNALVFGLRFQLAY